MTRKSAWKGTWNPNRRPYVTIQPDVMVSFQGETSVIGCGECRREVNFNDYITSVSTEAAVDSSPGSCTIQMTIPDNDVNDFYIDGQLIIIAMMEVEVYAKGYYLIGGFPQYYRTFWGLVSSVTKSWSNGVTTINISCKDILRWWELTTVVLNPSFLNSVGTSAGGYQLFQNQFAGQNPYSVIIQLARESMGDFSFTTGSFTSYKPELGAESGAIGSYQKDVMLYWQLKFANIWNSLVLYGSNGTLYFPAAGASGTVSAQEISKRIADDNANFNADLTEENSLLQLSPTEIAAFKIDVSRAGDVSFFQDESMSKLQLAYQARDQISYEFFCDPSGDIVFKPPFYNLNVLPNKPVSWVQDFEIIDDSTTDSEAEVYTHITSSGNAFGGVTDWGLNDEITTPNTGVFDYHLLRRYGWRKFEYQCEWAGNPRKLFYHLMDMLDRLNAKRHNGTVTIPMRPELRLGFPIWFPKYDSFYYVQGISHNYSVGGQATTTLTLIAKRAKFIAPSNLGTIKKGKGTTVQVTEIYKGPPGPKGKKFPPKKSKKNVPTYIVEFPDGAGDTTGLSSTEGQGQPVYLRDPKTGKLLGYPNVVMVFRTTQNGATLAKIIEESGSGTKSAKKSASKGKAAPSSPKAKTNYQTQVNSAFNFINGGKIDEIKARIRKHRYEAGMTNGGAYDYAVDTTKTIKDFRIIPTDSIGWGVGTGPNGPADTDGSGDFAVSKNKDVDAKNKDNSKKLEEENKKLKKELEEANKKAIAAGKELSSFEQKYIALSKKNLGNVNSILGTLAIYQGQIKLLQERFSQATDKVNAVTAQFAQAEKKFAQTKSIPGLSVIVRPVSDEFGFEVIGHYKYGRNSFIDRGKLKIGTSQGTANEINIQFAATGNILTESVNTKSSAALDFSKAFEIMQPDDYATGASFKQVPQNANAGQADYTVTSVQTYTSDIQANKGKAVFIEADSTRKAKTLAELKPTLSIDLLSDAIDDCGACGMNKSEWLSILPSSVIGLILSPPGVSSYQTNAGSPNAANFTTTTAFAASESLGVTKSKKIPSITPDKDFQLFETIEQKEQNTGATQLLVTGSVPSGSFFLALRNFLQSQFKDDIQENSKREKLYSGESLNKQNPNTEGLDITDQDNFLDTPSSAVLDRQINAMLTAKDSTEFDKARQVFQNQANFNFGQAKDAAQKLRDQYNQGPNLGDTLGDFVNQQGPIFLPSGSRPIPTTAAANFTTGDPKKQGQPWPNPDPTFQAVINPARGPVAPSPIDPSTKTAP